jgi:DNA modification methylase
MNLNRNSRTIQSAPASTLRLPGLLNEHTPMVKPVAWIAAASREVTKRGDVVPDTFLLSGSTLMAAEKTGRVKLDPLIVDVTIRPWQIANGRDAVLLETGKPFNVSAQRRLAGPLETIDGR